MSDQRTQENDDLVVGRGPVSGTGEAMSDADALAVLDERVEPSSSEYGMPNVGAVIDPETEQERSSSQTEPFVVIARSLPAGI